MSFIQISNFEKEKERNYASYKKIKTLFLENKQYAN